MKKFLIFIVLTIFLAGFAAVDEVRDVEKVNWQTLAKVEWVWDENFYRVNFNDEQQALDGKELIIEGFMFPLEYTREHSNFLVSSSPMSDCFFCGPGEAESMVYVKTKSPVGYSFEKMSLKGTFKLVEDASMGIIYELESAELVN